MRSMRPAGVRDTRYAGGTYRRTKKVLYRVLYSVLYICAQMGQVNIRVGNERVESVRQRLKDAATRLGVSQGDVLERGLDRLGENGGSDPGDLSQKIYERAGRIENMVEELLGLGVPAIDGEAHDVPPILRAAAGVEDNRPKNATCKHCGERFAGARFATICPGCKSGGHTLAPAECPR